MKLTDDDLHSTLNYIETWRREHGYPPTQREIARARGMVSPSAGAKMVRRLEAEGLIEVDRKTARTIRITAAGMKALEDHL